MMSLALRPAPRTAPSALATLTPSLLPPEPADEQGALALDFPVRSLPGPDAAVSDGPPAPGPTAQALTQAVIETLEGRRSPLQLQRACTAEVLTTLVRRSAARRGLAAAAHRPVIRRLRVTSPATGACEVAAVVVLGGRVRALAMCLRSSGERWVIDALELG